MEFCQSYTFTAETLCNFSYRIKGWFDTVFIASFEVVAKLIPYITILMILIIIIGALGYFLGSQKVLSNTLKMGVYSFFFLSIFYAVDDIYSWMDGFQAYLPKTFLNAFDDYNDVKYLWDIFKPVETQLKKVADFVGYTWDVFSLFGGVLSQETIGLKEFICHFF